MSSKIKVGDRITDGWCRKDPDKYGSFGTVGAIYKGVEDAETYFLVTEFDGHMQWWSSKDCEPYLEVENVNDGT